MQGTLKGWDRWEGREKYRGKIFSIQGRQLE
jgi:hypothetical protein